MRSLLYKIASENISFSFIWTREYIATYAQPYQVFICQLHVFFYISNQFISNQGSGFLKITIEYNGLLLCWTMENNRNFKQLWGLELSQVAYK